LAVDESTGLLAIPESAAKTALDRYFISYLNTLDGYPMGSVAAVGFDGALDPATVNDKSVRVFDVSADYAPVAGVTIEYSTEKTDAKAESSIRVTGPKGLWEPG